MVLNCYSYLISDAAFLALRVPVDQRDAIFVLFLPDFRFVGVGGRVVSGALW